MALGSRDAIGWVLIAGLLLWVCADAGADAGVRSMGYGLPGPVGQQGAKGDAGPAGAIGAAGPAGSAGAVGATGPQGSAGPKGDTGSTGSTGAQGSPGIVPIYGLSGLRANSKAWMGTVQSASGLWSASIASAGCTVAPWNVQVQALGLDQTAAGVRVANVSAVSTTTVSGTVTQPATVSLLGVLSLNLATASPTTVYVEAFCN